MGPDFMTPEVEFAIRVVREAAQLAARVQSGMALMNLTKSDLSPATVSDFAIQALLARELKLAFPGEQLVAEERSDYLASPEAKEVLDTVVLFVNRTVPEASGGDVCRWIDEGLGDPGGRFWVLDPIDGTKGYLRGGQYAVAMSLVEDGNVRLCVLGCPNLGEGCVPEFCGPGVLVAAKRDGGAWHTPLNEEADFAPMKVSECAEPAKAEVLRSQEAAHTNVEQIDRLMELMGVENEPVLMDSQAKYAVLAAGNGDLIFRLLSSKQPDYEEKIWDQAAASIIVEEAGGRISDLSGNPLDFTAGRTLARNRGVLASNGRLHAAALDAVAKL